MLRTTFNRHLNFPMHACEIIVTYHIISWISFTYTQEWFEQHSDTGISIEFHQLQKQIAWLQCGCFVLLWPTRKSQALNWNYLSLYQSAFYYKQDKKGKQTWLKEKPARGHHRGWDPNTICGPFRKKNRSSFQIYCASLQPTIWQVIVQN